MSSESAPDLATQLNALLPLIVTNGLRALGAIAILLIGLWAAGKLHAIVVGLLERTPHVDEMLKRFFGSAARYLVLTVTVLAVLSQFGIQTTSFAAVLGAAALAIGLALQGTLSHLAAGVMLLAFRPFRIGHKIQVSGVTGRVKDLTLFWTELTTEDKVQVILPNGGVWGQQLRNFSIYPAPAPSAQVHVRVPEESAVDDVLARVRSIVDAQAHVLRDPAPTVLLDRTAAENVLEVVVSFSTDGDLGAVRSDLIKAVHDALQGAPARRVAA